MKKRVLIDLDGVIRDFIGGVSTVYSQYYPDHEVKPVKSRELHEFYPIGYDIYNFIFEHHREWSEASGILPGAREAIQQYRDRYEIIIATSQEEWGIEDVYDWLDKHEVYYDDVVISFEKHLLDGIALLDDYEQNVEQFQKTGRLGVCFSQQWNQHWNNGFKVSSIEEFFELVKTKIKE
jgi:5'(3')-deoxyribonucleotidase